MTRDTIGTRVKVKRKAEGMSRKKLAEMTSYSESAIKLLESGKRNPSVDFLCRIGKALDVPLQYFLAEEKDSYIASCDAWDSRHETMSEEEKAQLLAVELEYCRHQNPYDKMIAIARIILPESGSENRK